MTSFRDTRIRKQAVENITTDTLYIDSCKISASVPSVLANTESLTSVSLRDIDLDTHLLDSLCSNTRIKHLRFSKLRISSQCVNILRDSNHLRMIELDSMHCIEEVLRNATVPCLGLMDIHLFLNDAIALSMNSHVTDLRLNMCHMEDAARKAITMNPFAKMLRIRSCSLIDNDILSLASNTAITSLCVSVNAVTDEGVAALANNNTLKQLETSWNYIRDAGATTLAQNTTITLLVAANCNITNAGAASLAKNTTITDLNLANNDIGSNGAIALARNTTLTKLSIGWNYVGDEGASALALNTSITWLNVAGNKIGDAGGTSLSKNTTLMTLSLERNYVGETTVQALASNTTLTDLVFWTHDRDAYSLFASNTSLIRLVTNDTVPSEVEERLKENVQQQLVRVQFTSTLFSLLACLFTKRRWKRPTINRS